MLIKLGVINLFMLCTVFAAQPICASDLFDPTRPANADKIISSVHVGTVHNSWTLESTIVAANRRVAVINGKLVSEGESVDGARIIKIQKLEVLIQTSSKRMTLQLLPDIIRVRP